MNFSSRNAAIGASVAAAVLLGAGPSQAQWWNLFERDRAPEQTQPQPQAPMQTAPTQLQTGPLPGTPVPTGPMQPAQLAPQGGAAAQAPVLQGASQIDRLEGEIRRLTGEVEQLQHELGQLRALVQQQQGGAPASQRQSQNEAPAPGVAAATPPAIDPQSRAELERALAAPVGTPMDASGASIGGAEGPMVGATGGSPGLGEPPRMLGTLSITGDSVPAANPPVSADPNAPLDLTALAQPQGGVPAVPDGQPQMASLPEDTPDVAYDRAYNMIVSGDYGPAEEGFRQFIQTFPDSPLVPDAQYWLGETYFARADYQNAADTYLTAYRSHPTSRKAPDTLLKLGLSLDALGQRKAACSSYAELLAKHPTTSNALKQRVKAEQVRAEC